MDAQEKLIAIIPAKLTSGRVSVSGHDIHYVETGSGPDVLLIHGINMGWGQWYPNLAALGERFHVVALDLPGSGSSSRLSPSDPSFPEILPEVVEEFIVKKGLKDLNLVGHSVGAWVALRVALRGRVPIKKMVLVSPLGFSTKTPSKYRALGFSFSTNLLSKTAMKLSRANMKKFATSVFYRPEELRDEFSDYYYEALKNQKHPHPFFWINRFSGFLKIRKEFVLLEKVSQLKMPILIVSGQHDGIVPPHAEHRAAFRRMSYAEIMIFSESGHVPPTEESVKFNEAVIQFLMK